MFLLLAITGKCLTINQERFNSLNQNLLLVDDDQELCALLNEWLTQDGFQVGLAHTTAAAQTNLQQKELPDAVILDVMLPDGNGLEFLRLLRTDYPSLPVLMLSARGEPTDRIIGLELGADDYLAKPCDPRELTARLKAVLRRTQTLDAQTDNTSLPLIYGDLEYNPVSGVLLLNNTEVNLTLTEGKVLEVLLQTPGEPITKQKLTELALGRKLSLYDRSIDMHISNLRRKLGQFSNGDARILSIRGRGYYYAPYLA